jgi:hypothetical protein
MVLVYMIYIILVVFLVVQLISSIIFRRLEGSPAKDKDILELFEKKGEQYDRISTNWEDIYYIESWNTSSIRRIQKSNRWFIFYPYIIQDVGVVPIWYKSRKIIDAKFKELLKDSKYNVNKRKKLGLE